LRLLRSPRELAFRLRQEARNVALLLHAPRQRPALAGMPLPDPAGVVERLRGSAFEREIMRLAGEICEHRFPLLGLTIETGPEIRWRRDYASGIETGLEYFRRVPYLDASRAGDHKIIWELNRHQHLVVLAQAFLFTGDERLLREIAQQLKSWIAQNPFQRGINWASALEVAFRALSWVWIHHLLRERAAWLGDALYLHGLHLENNLSFYFSPNTHLLGEAVALHALGLAFGQENWRALGARVVEEQMEKQVREDGGHFEQSTYYHVYALDMFLFHAVLGGGSATYRDKLARMATYLAAVAGPRRAIPFLGDDDGGRFFHPFGPRDRFGRATLATCSVLLDGPEWLSDVSDLREQAVWWLGPDVLDRAPAPCAVGSTLFRDTGIAVMTAGPNHIVVDAGPFGPWGSGHSHSDTLSIVARAGEDEILIDPGTYTYVGDIDRRNWFRGSAAHNTIRIDHRDQAIPAGPFRWTEQPRVSIVEWKSSEEQDFLEATCAYGGFLHRRRVVFHKPDLLLIVDDVSGPEGVHEIEQFWHVVGAQGRLVLEENAEELESWRSTAFAVKQPAKALRVVRRARLPQRFAAAVLLGPVTDLEIARARRLRFE
jgi:hypothetical protein